MANHASRGHTLRMAITSTTTGPNIYVSTSSPQTSSTQVKHGFTGQTIRVGSLRVASAGR